MATHEDIIEFDWYDKDKGGARDYSGQYGITKEERSGLIKPEGISLRRRMSAVCSKKDKIMMAQMKANMAALWADGIIYDDICETINERYDLQGDQKITAHAVQYHIKKMLNYWRQKGLALMDERQAVILTRLDQVEALALEAYFLSQEGKRTTTKKKQIDRARKKEKVQQGVEKEREDRAHKEAYNTRSHGGREKDPYTNELFIDTGELISEDGLLDLQERIEDTERYEENNPGDVKFLNLVYQINVQRAKILGLYNKREQLNADQEAAKMSDKDRRQRVATILSAAQQRRNSTLNMLAPSGPLGGFKDAPPLTLPDVPKIEDKPEPEFFGWDDPDEESEEFTSWL